MRGTQYIYNLCIYLDIEYCPEETYVIPDQTNMNPGIQREPENSGMIVDSHLDSASHYTLGALDQQYNTVQYSTVQYSTIMLDLRLSLGFSRSQILSSNLYGSTFRRKIYFRGEEARLAFFILFVHHS